MTYGAARMKCFAWTAAAVLAATLTSTPAAAADPPKPGEKRAVPDYGGPPRPTTAGNVAAWPARVVLFPPWVVNELVLRRPLGLLVTSAEKGAWIEKLEDFFSFGPRKQVTILPSALFDFGLKPSVGLNAKWKYFLADPNTLNVHFGTWGPRWIALNAADVYDVSKHEQLSLEGLVMRRADNRFHGIGPLSSADSRSRFSTTAWSVGPGYSRELWRTSAFRAGAGIKGLGFHEGGCCNEPTLEDEIRAGRTEAPGYGQNYLAAYQRASLVLDSRKPKPAPGSGFRVEARGEAVQTLENTAASPRRSWIRWGGLVGGAVDLTGTQRVLSLTVDAEFADPLQGTIPFTDQVNIGGDTLMPGYLRGRLVDRSAVIGTVQYRWPIWVFLDAILHASVGNVFGEHLEGLAVKDMRLSSGIGLRSNGSREAGFEALLAGGTDPFSEGFKVSSFRLLIGSHHGF